MKEFGQWFILGENDLVNNERSNTSLGSVISLTVFLGQRTIKIRVPIYCGYSEVPPYFYIVLKFDFINLQI